MKTELKELAEFLVEAKKATYAGDGNEVKNIERDSAKELFYIKRGFEYRDSYFGFFSAPGQEVVRFKGKPIWAMAYSGGMKKGYLKINFAAITNKNNKLTKTNWLDNNPIKVKANHNQLYLLLLIMASHGNSQRIYQVFNKKLSVNK